MEKITGVQQCMGHTLKKHSNRREREWSTRSSNFCGIQRVPVQRHQNRRKLGIRICLWKAIKEYVVYKVSRSIEVKKQEKGKGKRK